MLVSASEQLVVLPNGEYYKNALDPAAAERTAEWTQNYDFNAPAPEKGMSTGAKTALGILGAIVIGTVIHEATDDDDDDDRGRGRDDGRSPPTRQPPEDSPPPSDERRPPPDRVQRRPYPVRQPQPTACCVAGTTHQLTPAQCEAKGGERGACRGIR